MYYTCGFDTCTCPKEDANYAATISEVKGLKRIVGLVYFHVPDNEGVNNIMTILGMDYPELCKEDYRLDINRVRDGRRVGRV